MADQDAPKLRYNCYLLREHLPMIEHALRAKYRPGGREGMTTPTPTSAAPQGAVAYLGTTEPRTPKWAENLEPMFSGVASLINQAHRVVVFLPVRNRHFAVCFGYGSAALEWDALETNFGLRVAARRFKPNRISELRSRKIDVTARTSPHCSSRRRTPRSWRRPRRRVCAEAGRRAGRRRGR
jgi:uncharacterized protein (TIGR04141 family)